MCENQHPQYKFDFHLSTNEKNAMQDILAARFSKESYTVWRYDDHCIKKVEQTLAMVKAKVEAKAKDKTVAKA
jgi:hypothetical protein